MRALYCILIAAIFAALFCSWGCTDEQMPPEVTHPAAQGAAGETVPIIDILVGIGPTSDDAGIAEPEELK